MTPRAQGGVFRPLGWKPWYQRLRENCATILVVPPVALALVWMLLVLYIIDRKQYHNTVRWMANIPAPGSPPRPTPTL